MNLEKAVAEFRTEVARKKGYMKDGRLKEERIEVLVIEDEDGKVRVEFSYFGEWRIMFGKVQTHRTLLWEGDDLKHACKLARHVKAQMVANYGKALPLRYVKHEPLEWI